MPNRLSRRSLLTDRDAAFLGQHMSADGEGDPVRMVPAVAAVDLRSGDRITFPKRGVTALVGSNNVGKSLVLSEIYSLLSRNGPHEDVPRKVVGEIEVRKDGTATDMVEWLLDHATYLKPNDAGNFVFREGAQVSIHQSVDAWKSPDNCFGQLQRALVNFSSPIERMNWLRFTERRDRINDAPIHPLHYLESDQARRLVFEDHARSIFRQDLTFDVLGRLIGYRLGRCNVPVPAADAITSEYQAAVAGLPELSQQGLGMQSLLGLLMLTAAGTYPILLVDEPEAFLHPPQAFELGRILGRMPSQGQVQIILATHDKNILAGLLAEPADVSVVRLDRTDDMTRARQLAADDLKALWSDPILRYTNVLDGLFYRKVVVTEGDADCRFYQAALDEAEAETGLEHPTSEVLFIPASGKTGIVKFVGALRAVGVQVIACPDLDIFENDTDLEKIIKAYGRDWALYADRYNHVVQHLRGQAPTKTVSEVLDTISTEFDSQQAEPWSSVLQKKARDLTRMETGWSLLKKLGMVAFDDGDRQAADALVEEFAAFGLRVVREGVLESFAPGLGVKKGPRWLPAAFDAGCHQSEQARAHACWLIKDVGA